MEHPGTHPLPIQGKPTIFGGINGSIGMFRLKHLYSRLWVVYSRFHYTYPTKTNLRTLGAHTTIKMCQTHDCTILYSRKI